MIHQLHIHQLRNLQTPTSVALTKCNLIVGQNGSGKTSLLEAVFLLSRGKSFRHHEPKRYITHHARSCVVWAKTDVGTLALQKHLDANNCATTTLKSNGVYISSQSVLSEKLPVLFIDPTSLTLLEEGSQRRRQLLDWIVFHVEPAFYPDWLAYQRVLRQRNNLLKSPNTPDKYTQLTAWDRQLSIHAQRLHDYRQKIFHEWHGQFKQMIARLLPKYHSHLSLNYQAGFDDKIGLFDILNARQISDVEIGYTRIGAHRADVVVGFWGDGVKEQATTVLSRGEKKLLVVALVVSQLQVVCQQTQKSPIVLMDDIDAELDSNAIELLLEMLVSLPCQLMITSLSTDIEPVIQQKIAEHACGQGYQRLMLLEGKSIAS